MMRRSAKELYCQQVYSVVWNAHQLGEIYLSLQEICDRLATQGINLTSIEADFVLQHLSTIGYVLNNRRTGSTSYKNTWRLTKHAIAANAETVGKPLGGFWQGCKVVRIPPAMANDERFKTIPMEELKKYARQTNQVQ